MNKSDILGLTQANHFLTYMTNWFGFCVLEFRDFHFKRYGLDLYDD
jgi:hypothetical protein